MSFQLIYTLALLGVTLTVMIAYVVRVAIKGRARSARVDKQGASGLLSKDVMEGAYWLFNLCGRLLVFLRITPNMVSWGSLAFGLIAGACLAVGHFGSAAIFATLCAIFDALDGMVARMMNQCSDAGEVLDAAVDRYVEFAFIGGLVIYYRAIPELQILALLALLGSFMVSYSTAKAEALQVSPPKGNMRRPERAVILIVGAAFSPATIWWFERAREYPIEIGHPMVAALALVGVLSNVSAIERFWAIAKQIRVREAELSHQAAHNEEEHPEVAPRHP